VCFLANVGQEEPWDEVEKKALKIGAEKMVRVTALQTPHIT
jgi:argininosuccinate synthase